MSDTDGTRTFPVIPLDDAVVLPGMVVPLDLSDAETRAAVDAASASASGRQGAPSGKPEVLLVPRLTGTYANVGVIGVVEELLGRCSGKPLHRRGGAPDLVVLGIGAAHPPLPRAALWVEAVAQDEPPITGRTRELAKEYKELAISILQHREAWQVVDVVQAITDPSALADTAGYAPYLSEEKKVELLETASVDGRLEKLLAWGREHLAELDVAETIRKDVQDGMDKQQREFRRAASWPRSARSWPSSTARRPPRRRTTASASRPPTSPTRSARRP